MHRPDAPSISSLSQIPPFAHRSVPLSSPSANQRTSGFTIHQHSSSLKSSRPSTATDASFDHDMEWMMPTQTTSHLRHGDGDTVGTLQTLSEDEITNTKSSSSLSNHDIFADVERDTHPPPAVVFHPSSVGSTNDKAGLPSDYTWPVFITAYASGRWDPSKTPPRPRSQVSTPVPPNPDHENSQRSQTFVGKSASLDTQVDIIQSHDSGSSSSSKPIRSNQPSVFPLKLPLSSRRLGGTQPKAQTPVNHASSTSDVQTAVATMRWAAARVDMSPLALPSPERELTDPLRGFTAVVPGSHLLEKRLRAENTATFTPGGTRRSRLSEFWEGTTAVENPATPTARQQLTSSDSSDSVISTKTITEPQDVTEDYFPKAIDPVPSDLQRPALTDAIIVRHRDSETSIIPAVSPSIQRLQNRPSAPRQISSPLPSSEQTECLVNNTIHGRVSKEEHDFASTLYLAPPYPPNETQRRRALHKFNLWNTGADIHFDRVAHLAKLVFNTKGVAISLIDSDQQWFKSEWGLKMPSCLRSESFCGHTILQRGDEPMIILDTTKDWRFSNNPMVVNAPFIRFYAGAPLRTHDGFNIGTLAVIGDEPRDDFPPRQRHALKEFAAVAMREMEFWRDQIQLRIRDRIQSSLEQFSRECLEIDTPNHAAHPELAVGSSMDKVYDRAAKLVQRTLDVEGVTVMDVSHCEVLEAMNSEGNVSVTMHYGDPDLDMGRRQLTTEEYKGLNEFFEKHPKGKISEGIAPASFKPFLPTQIQYALTVPIFNIDKRPFALLCAYNTQNHPTRYLEGHELSYLRAIGVIILSAVLKRRMLLADKAKGLFISNISHELRTPLHGILAAAELLSESSLNHSQASYLQTVQACGTSLVETVNHVLDFTKLSGNSKSGGVENVILPTTVDLMRLVEDAVDGCWIGHCARMTSSDDSGIGSVYSPPKEEVGSPLSRPQKNVETVIDVGFRGKGWLLKCEKAGMRRVLMNLFGNSLKFTTEGYIHVLLRQLPHTEDDLPNHAKIELAVYDTGKGISQNFLKNQLFHPFSQENPLQTGTGLGLAIVSSIVTSENVGGKVDVWSEEGVGTEIKVTFPAELTEQSSPEVERFSTEDSSPLPTVSLAGFSTEHKGAELLRRVLSGYVTDWWGLKIVEDGGDILIVNDDPAPVIAATEAGNIRQKFIILSAARGSTAIMDHASQHERIGGFCRILYKPGGPVRLHAILKLGVEAFSKNAFASSPNGFSTEHPDHPPVPEVSPGTGNHIQRRSSTNMTIWDTVPSGKQRPRMAPRSVSAANTVTKSGQWTAMFPPMPPSPDVHDPLEDTPFEGEETPDVDAPASTIALGTGAGTLLKSSIGALVAPVSHFRVLIVEDNSILRNLLMKWLSTKGYDFRHAVDGQDGVNVFRNEGPFNVVLLDLSMPVLDGVGATAEIRKIEADILSSTPDYQKTQILALTGRSSLEDKRRAFAAGVDGYLVKPVAFRTLEEMFQKLCKPA